MKKKVISLILCTGMLLCVLTGCIHQDTGVKINKNGTGSITTTVGLEKSFYEQMKEMDSDPFEGKSVTEYQFEGATYVSYAETKQYSSYEDMEKALLELTYETDMLDDAQNAGSDIDTEEQAEENLDSILDITTDETETVLPESEMPDVTILETDNHIFSSVNIEKNGGIFYSAYTFNAVLNPQSNSGLDYDLNEAIRVTLSVEMPNEITDVKGGTADGNKAVFDVADITESQELSATSEGTNTGVVVGTVLILVLVVACLFFWIKIKK